VAAEPTFDRMSRAAALATFPSRTTRMIPVWSVTNKRPLPSSGATMFVIRPSPETDAGEAVTVGATLVDTDEAPVVGQTISFAIGAATGTGTTDASGHAIATLTLQGAAAATTLGASFAGAGAYGRSSASASFVVLKEDTTLTLADAVGTKNARAIAQATLAEADGAKLSGKAIQFFVQEKVKNNLVWTPLGTAVTDANGVASLVIPARYVSTLMRPIRATFAGDTSFLASTDDALAYR